MSVHALPANRPQDALQRAKVELAAVLRLASLHELDEGIDNHFTVMVPGHTDRFLILPFGIHWSEARASDMVVFDETGRTLEGEGKVELSALCIHAPIHRITGAQAVFHTHQTHALALNMLKDNRLLSTSQTAAFFDGRIVYDDNYTGLADTLAEGERLAGLLNDDSKTLVFMKNHGVLSVGDTIAQAYRWLYRLERVCRNQLLAMGTGQPLAVLSQEVVDRVKKPNPDNTHSTAERERLFLEAMMRVLDRENPGYAD